MATRTISNSGGTRSWSDTATWVEGAVPLAGDDVVATATSGNVTVTAASVCRSMILTGYLGTMSGSGDLSIGDASGGACTLAGTMSGTWTTTFKSTSNNGGTGWSITSNGQVFPGFVSINGVAGKWVLQDAFSVSSTKDLFVSNGGFFGNAQTITCRNFDANVATTRTVDLTNCTVTVAGSWTFTTTTNLTFVSTGSTITLQTAAAATFSGGGLTYRAVSMNGSGNAILNGANTFLNFTRTGTASFNDALFIGADQVVTGTLTFGGNTTQGTNRLAPVSSVRGTQRTLNCSGGAVVISGDVDFQDIAITGAPSWTNAGSAFVSDSAGNGSLIVSNRTAPLTLFRVGAGGNFTASNWSLTTGGATGQRVPLSQDTVKYDAGASGTITFDIFRFGGDTVLTGFAGTIACGGFTREIFGNINLGTTATLTNTGTGGLGLAGRGSHTITNGGRSFTNLSITGPGGTYTAGDAFLATGAVTVSGGTWATGSQSVSLQTFVMNNALGAVSGTGTWSITQTTAVTVWSVTAGTTTLSSSTLVISVASALTRTFAGGGQVYGTLTYTVASSPGQLTVTGSNSFTTTNIGSGRVLVFTSGTTTTITGGTNSFNVNGVANGYIYLPGVAGHYLSSPDSAALSITSDIDIRIRVALDDWTPSVSPNLVTKYGSAGQRGYALSVGTDGTLALFLSSDGTVATGVSSSSATGLVDGSVKWVRVTWRNSDDRVQFWMSDDGSTWTQLGTDVTLAKTGIFDNTAPLEIGSFAGGTSPLTGKVYRVQIRNNVLDDGTGIQFDADLTRSLASAGWLDTAKTQFTESSVNAATVTINGVMAQAGGGRVVLTSSVGGSQATLSSAADQTVAFVSIKDSNAIGGGKWIATFNSVNAP